LSRYYIDWNQSAAEVSSFIRGLSPYPGAWTKLKQQEQEKQRQLKIFNVSVSETLAQANPGKIVVQDKQLFIGTETATLEIIELQLEGKKRMTSRELLNGIALDKSKVN